LVVEVVGVGSVVVGGGLAVVVVVDIAVVAGCSAAELLSKLKAVNASAITTSSCQL